MIKQKLIANIGKNYQFILFSKLQQGNFAILSEK